MKLFDRNDWGLDPTKGFFESSWATLTILVVASVGLWATGSPTGFLAMGIAFALFAVAAAVADFIWPKKD